MRVAFHAPLKPPTHDVPSGDRRMARLIMAALTAGGHAVELASELRTYDGAGDEALQRRHAVQGRAEAERLIARWSAAPAEAPDAWLTYHVYHKAPDFIGPEVARHFALPYLIAEPSNAAKRQSGPWAFGHARAAHCIVTADRLLYLTEHDLAGLRALAPEPGRLSYLPPFVDAAPFQTASGQRARARARLGAEAGLDPEKTWLLAVAMMRPGDKLESYRRLGRALGGLGGGDWQLAVVGDGAARGEVEAALAALAPAVRFLGARDWGVLPSIHAACDIYVWPAANEAYGMALLEAQAAGLPVVAGRVRGVPDAVIDGQTGWLVPEDDASAFALAVRRLIDDKALRARLATNAARFIAAERDLAGAARVLNRALTAARA